VRVQAANRAVALGEGFYTAGARERERLSPRAPAVSPPIVLLDAETVRRAARGDEAALGAMYRRFAPRLWREVLWPILRDTTRAEDALCETFLAVLPGIERFIPEPGRDPAAALFAWVARIARRKAIDELRRAERTRRASQVAHREVLAFAESVQPAGPERALESGQAAARRTERIEAVLSEIHGRYAEALRLRFLGGVSREDSADALGVSVPTFDVLLHRALRAFRAAYVLRYGDEPEEVT
jgi:RNA polymerase sigma-70 factor (ECF subfamily)